MTEIRQIAVVGGGLMGTSIAQVFAAAGHGVAVFEPDANVRDTVQSRAVDNLRLIAGEETAVERIRPVADLGEAIGSADYVTEAAPERLELKRAIFADLVRLAPRAAILASNTSVIPITQIARGLETADRIVGTHWWNPAHLVPLVEVVQAAETSDSTIAATMELLTAIGKQPAHVKKDLPGFVANRLQHALWREAIAMVAEGVCDAATLDHCVKTSFGLRLPVLGPLENADLIGLDLTLDIHKVMMPQLDRHAAPHAYLERRVADGHLGFKTGEGFQSWTHTEQRELRERLVAHLFAARRDSCADRLSGPDKQPAEGRTRTLA